MNRQAIDKLVQEDRLRRIDRPAWDQVDRLLASSQKDLQIVRKILDIDEGRAYDVAYDVMFKTGMALMRAHRYRLAPTMQHKTTIEFCEAALDPTWKPSLDFLDDMRKKRNRFTYEGDVTVGRQEAEAAIAEAEKFRAGVVKVIDGLRPPPPPPPPAPIPRRGGPNP